MLLKSGQLSIKKRQISLKENYFDRIKIKIFILDNTFLFIILVNN